jgi:DNA-nicking Smr family endonuclease
LLSQNTIDLHGLQVAEAKSILSVLLHRFKKKNITEITIITGKGIHSADGVARIKPEVELVCLFCCSI